MVLNRNLQLNIILFANDLVLVASSEDGLQRSLYNLQLVCSQYHMEISFDKTKNYGI